MSVGLMLVVRGPAGRFIDRETAMLADCDSSPSKTQMIATGWGASAVAREQLYDLALDPGEASNLAGDPRAAAALEEMRGRLERWMKRTGDPLLRGPIVAPSGAIVNRSKDVEPQDVWRYTEKREDPV